MVRPHRCSCHDDDHAAGQLPLPPLGEGGLRAAGPDRAVEGPALLADGWVLDSTTAPVSYVRGESRLLVQEVAPGEYTSVGYPLYRAEWEPADGRAPASAEVGDVVPAGSPGTVLVLATEYFRQ